ncbi:unnamed protein product [Blepharisma stoltei]|uniref:Uncharacterized protein n=1 Tax=Blepharisma stoltei TaxID=1481888 RepID=A0AAU9K3P6_9CILI|nr:unnamed protein product [Blepharisma stoltei]
MSSEPGKKNARSKAKRTENKEKKESSIQENIHWSLGFPNAKDAQEIMQEKAKHQAKLLELHEEVRNSFFNDGVSHQSQVILRRIVQNPAVPQKYEFFNLLDALNTAHQEMLMNELELAVWEIYLEKFVWKDKETPLLLLLMLSAFAVKSYFNEDVSTYQAYLSVKYPGFLEAYEKWYNVYKNDMNISPIELNDKFRDLNKFVTTPGDTKVVDYNYYVDEILQNSASYTVKSKDSLQRLTNDQEIMDIYSAYIKREPIIINNQQILDTEMLAPTLSKLDSVLSGIETEGLNNFESNKASGVPIIASNMVLERIDSICTEILLSQENSHNKS